MEKMHTQEPWKVSGTENIVSGGNYVVALDCKPEDARRIVACVNACAGLPTEMLEEGGIPSIAQHMKLEKQRDELQEEVNALKERAEYDLAEFARTLDISYDEIKLLKKQRDDLLAALKRAEEAMEVCSDWMVEIEMSDGWTTTTDEKLKISAAIAASKSNAA